MSLAIGGANTTDGEILVTETERERNKLSRYSLSSVGSTKYVVLVDLSDITNWPHTSTGRIDISFIGVTVDRAANSVGSVRIGVVTRVDATNGDLSYFFEVNFTNAADTFISRSENYAPSQIKCGVSAGGVTTAIVGNDKLTNSTAIQTDVALDSFRGATTVSPAVGDIIGEFTYTSGTAYGATMRILYHSETTSG